MSERSSAEAALGTALADCGAAFASDARQPSGGEVELIDELLQSLEEAGGHVTDGEAGSLADWLEAFSGPGEERRESLADIVSLIVRDLAPEDAPPAEGGEAELWHELVILTDRLYGSGVAPLGRLPFINDRLLELLAEEAKSSSRRVDRAGEAGRYLASLAVSRKLCDAVGTAVGIPLAPTHRAVYLYDIPESHVKTHVDTHEYEVVFHLILDHVTPDGVEGSALVVHRVGEAEAYRVRLQPGEAVALRGRGTIHSWEPMGPLEERTLLAIGFQHADRR